MNLIQSLLSANKWTLNVKNTKDMFIGSQFKLSQIRDGPLENLWGGGGATMCQKIYIYSRKGKLNEKKNRARQLFLKKYSCYGLKKNSCKEFDSEKEFVLLENSPPSPLLWNRRSVERRILEIILCIPVEIKPS